MVLTKPKKVKSKRDRKEVMMKVELRENVLTVMTGVKKEAVEKGIAQFKAINEKNGAVDFEIKMVGKNEGNISQFGLYCNTVVDGELAVTIVLDMDTTADQVKAKYGKALVEAEKYCEKIAEKAVKDTEAVNKLFEAE